MRKHRRIPICALGSALCVATALAVVLGGCEKGRGSTPIPSQPTPFVVALELVGPDTVPPGTTAQFTATARYSDGASRNVSAEAVWRSSSPSVLAISSSGLAFAGERGESSISAAFDRRTAVKAGVVVVPPGTYRLVGTVRDDITPVSGARVDVIGSNGSALSTTADGTYRLYGVSGDIEIRVTKEGYQEQSKRVHMAAHSTIDFDLTPTRPRDDVAGVYTLTINAAEECRAALPADARDPTYTAVLTQNVSRVQAQLDGATFVLSNTGHGNHFAGTVQPNGVTFLLNRFLVDGYFYYRMPFADLVEEITPSLFLAVDGSVLATISPARLEGTLNGTFQVFTIDPRRGYPPVARCESAHHRFLLRRS